MKSRIAILLSVTLAVLVLAMGLVPKVMPTSPVVAQQELSYMYSVPFVCGIAVDECKDGVKVANYATKIDIHNPEWNNVSISWKVTRSLPTPIKRSGWQSMDIPWDASRALKCDKIVKRVGLECPTGYGNGFVVIISPWELDVYAVYTTESDTGLSIDVEPIYPTEIMLP